MERLVSFLRTFVILLFIVSCHLSAAIAQEAMHGDYWKQQVLDDVLAPWQKHAKDQEYGAYHTYLNKDWEVVGPDKKYPGMIARHMFSFSVGYLLSGESQHLNLARDAFEFLVKNAWDEQYGGWYYELDRAGKVLSRDKDMFTHAYAITGLAMYYIVTRDARVKSYLDRSIRVLEEHAWDKANGGGYFQGLHRDLSVKDANKVFSPQLAPVSGYLLYLHAATGQDKYLKISERILDTTLKHMEDKRTGWVMEAYDRNWAPLVEKNRMMNTGHNVEVAWMLMRLYALTGKEGYREKALALNENLIRYAFDPETGMWYHRLKVDSPEEHSQDSPWWVQAYGNMLQLYLYAHLGEECFWENYQKGAAFWNKHFLDAERGGEFTSVGRDGSLLDSSKAGKYKTSYHAVENGLLNMMYLDYWVNRQPLTLYYHINSPVTEDFFPLLLEARDYDVKEVLLNGKRWKKRKNRNGSIKLPAKGGYDLVVQVQKKSRGKSVQAIP
ncbi:mannose/cellobiose epimerase-like protein (N-acyl-D-glucosamine 2-epimerase family) [Pontibacter ummariensis]|uniref:Mannose or cellobiose epimerase, N-acyl-D-glucosamine 2-epimerase family n=1 Tax=Pontibacter ummariensis TaxID=1610492 RepID=A0A239F5A9_9BACT|nr:AGE family epimerase/isomerase [Pontibacter ummariensis]PRY12437.1 mannose/cellobiose epimerase-like protein (N-acyl-D-glucosamine 2-epimerase family) [Pontibacter ummariensis]SNS51688.1 Mannose or cellobiose epimerase, N-acyl-D-glucosamine 2-epimerase family [Pontibacter ummariensis]